MIQHIVVALVVSLLLSGSTYADDWYRMELQSPIFFSSGTPSSVDDSDNGIVTITVSDDALVDGVVQRREDHELNIGIQADGMASGHSLIVSNLPSAALWIPNLTDPSKGRVTWNNAVAGFHTLMIEVRDTDNALLLSQPLHIVIHPGLTASVPQEIYTVEKNDALVIPATAGNAIGNVLWSGTTALPDWVNLNDKTGIIQVNTSEIGNASDISLTAVDQFDNAIAKTQLFSITINGVASDYWISTLGGSDADSGSAITMDTHGSLYVTGHTRSDTSGDMDLLLTKYSVSGDLSWKRTLKGTGNDQGIDAIVTSDGHIHIAGRTDSTGNSGQMLFARYASDGSFNHTMTLGGAKIEYGRGIAMAPDGSSYIAGQTASTNESGIDLLLAKYTSSGDLDWTSTLGGTGSDQAEDITVGSDGSIYVAGYTNSTTTGTNSLLLTKYTSSGTLLWKKILGGANDSYGYAVAVDSNGSTYTTGNVSAGKDSDIFLVKYDVNGELLWKKILGGVLYSRGNGIFIHNESSIYIIGETTGSGRGDADMLIAKYNNHGDLIWMKTLGGISDDRGRDLLIGYDDYIYAAEFTSSIGEGVQDLFLTRLPSNGGNDMNTDSLYWQDATLIEKDASALAEISSSWAPVNATLLSSSNPTGLSENNASFLIDSHAQFRN